MSNIVQMVKPKMEQKLNCAVTVKQDTKKSKKSEPAMREIEKHLHNLREILLNTNATVIRCHDGNGYACAFCNESSFPDPADLKSHALSEHTDLKQIKFIKKCRLEAYIVKLDMTSLKCMLCQNHIASLEKLMSHLTQEHDKKLFMDINNHIIPFAFDKEEFTCIVCAKTCISFKILQEHMSVHYGRYFCGLCSAPFVNPKALKNHMAQHKQGDFNCQLCSKVFDTSAKRNYHIKAVHQGALQKRNKCHICLEMFSTHKKKMDHMVDSHGAEPKVFKCLACDKTFNCRGTLTTHTKKDHLMERRYECKLCEKKFFTSNNLKNHMLTHTGAREFQCDVCKKWYGRKYTLRLHMRFHAGYRRFKCEICGQAFVQKCSWKRHMRSKHGIAVGN